MTQAGLLADEITAIRAKLAAVLEAAEATPIPSGRRRNFDSQVRGLIKDLEAALSRLDPIVLPESIFDPSDPKIIGRFTALALVAQTVAPLASLGRFYGSGVYALYYTGA